MFDVAAARETRREQQGYVSPAQAHAFLRAARDIGIDAPQPPPSAIARAYSHASESALADADVAGQAPGANEGPALVCAESAGAVEVLREAGLRAPPHPAPPVGFCAEPPAPRRRRARFRARSTRWTPACRSSTTTLPTIPKASARSHTWRMPCWRDAQSRDARSPSARPPTAPSPPATSAWKTGRH